VSDITLSGAKLYTSHKTFAAQWSDSVLENVRFDRCTFRKLSLSNVEFDTMTSMTRCRLYDITGDHVSLRCTLRETALVDTNFTDLDAYNVVMQESKLINVDVQGRPGTFNNAVFDHVTFENVRFTRCDFQLARFVDCYFENVTFYDCNLSDALIRNVGTMGVTVDEDTIRNTVSPEGRNFLRTVH
jgi:uncharacterized protein YjbI with pentapeptide repeats